tara:strand:+ start:1746 stop:2105 length:360 start_codon:yes stop_codon:yes gene_type:complete
MTDIILNSVHDLLITNGDISLFEKLEPNTAQRVEINLLNFLGEWFRDVNTGVPYLQTILGRRNSLESANVEIKATIINTENISTITQYSSSIDNNRKLTVIFSATLESGGTINNISVEV